MPIKILLGRQQNWMEDDTVKMAASSDNYSKLYAGKGITVKKIGYEGED
jgi:hypothetical protein